MPIQKHQEKRLRLNNLIRSPQVQVIDAEGKHLGVMQTYEAIKLAADQELDLVEVGPSAKPPIAKIMDYGKYMYQKEKKEKESKSNKSTGGDIKTVKIGFKTGSHDMAIRAGQIDKFLQKGHKVRAELKLRGRERSMADIGQTKLQELLKLVTQPYTMEAPIKRAPSGLNALIKPEK
ncbi:MAG: translation initiation factor IF-3 [Candidatus Paceibacterota bacterium]